MALRLANRRLRDLLAGIRWPGGYGVNNPQPVWDPSIAARAEAERTAKNVALSPPPAATQPIIEGGAVSSNPQTPASRVAVEMGNVQDANEVVRKVRDAVLGTDNPVIQNAADQNPSELSASGGLPGAKAHLEGACYVGGQQGDDGSRSSMIWEGCDGPDVRRPRDLSGQWVKDPYAPPTDHSRSTEYPSGYRQSTHDALAAMWTDEGRAQGGVPVDVNGNRIPRGELHWRDEFDELIPHEELTYEHLHAVVQHWNTIGYNAPRIVRNDWYNHPANLMPMTRSENSSGGGRIGAKMRYRQDTGPNYRAF